MTYTFDWSSLNSTTLLSWVALDHISLSVLDYGLRAHFLDESDCVQVELKRLNGGVHLTSVEIDLALKLKDDLAGVAEIVDRGSRVSGPPDPQRLWMFVGVSELRRRWGRSTQPWYELDDLIESFGEPNRYSEFSIRATRPLFSKVPSEDSRLRRLDDLLMDDALAFGSHN